MKVLNYKLTHIGGLDLEEDHRMASQLLTLPHSRRPLLKQIPVHPTRTVVCSVVSWIFAALGVHQHGGSLRGFHNLTEKHSTPSHLVTLVQ